MGISIEAGGKYTRVEIDFAKNDLIAWSGNGTEDYKLDVPGNYFGIISYTGDKGNTSIKVNSRGAKQLKISETRRMIFGAGFSRLYISNRFKQAGLGDTSGKLVFTVGRVLESEIEGGNDLLIIREDADKIAASVRADNTTVALGSDKMQMIAARVNDVSSIACGEQNVGIIRMSGARSLHVKEDSGAAILTKLITAPATEASLEDVETEVTAINVALQTSGITQLQLAAIVTDLAANELLLADIKTAVELLDNAIASNEMQVDVITSALPSGGATSALQTASQTVLDDILGKICEVDTGVGAEDTTVGSTTGSFPSVTFGKGVMIVVNDMGSTNTWIEIRIGSGKVRCTAVGQGIAFIPIQNANMITVIGDGADDGKVSYIGV